MYPGSMCPGGAPRVVRLVFCFSSPPASGAVGAALFLRSFGSHSNVSALQQVEAQKRPKLASLPPENPFANRPYSLALVLKSSDAASGGITKRMGQTAEYGDMIHISR